MLIDDHYRAWVIRQIKDPFIRQFWAEEYAGYDPRFQREAIAPIQNKVGQFLLNPVIRNILGQVRCKVSIPFVMDNRRIFIANLSKGQIGQDKANLLGSLLVTQFQLGAMARAKQSEANRRDFYLFINEFQNFATESFASILAEARKYRLSLVLSHQYVEQLPSPIRHAVFGNVGTLIVFRIGHTDAEEVGKEFKESVSAQLLAELERYQAVVKPFQNGTAFLPFSGQMLPPLGNRIGGKPTLITRSRDRFTSHRPKLEEKMDRWINLPQKS
jgi:hypothetical protein